MGTFLVSRSRLPGLLWTRARKNANFLQERGTRKNRNANFEFLWWNKEHIREVNITVYNCMHGDQNYEYIFFYSLCCPYTVIQIAELTARGDSFVAKWLREMSDGFSRPTALLPPPPPPPNTRHPCPRAAQYSPWPDHPDHLLEVNPVWGGGSRGRGYCVIFTRNPHPTTPPPHPLLTTLYPLHTHSPHTLHHTLDITHSTSLTRHHTLDFTHSTSHTRHHTCAFGGGG